MKLELYFPPPQSPDPGRGDHEITDHSTHKPRYNNVQNPKSCLMIVLSLPNAMKMPQDRQAEALRKHVHENQGYSSLAAAKKQNTPAE